MCEARALDVAMESRPTQSPPASSGESEMLARLAAEMGIVASFQDIQGRVHTLSTEDRRRVLVALGLPADSEAALARWVADHRRDPPGPLVMPAVAVRVPVPGGKPGAACHWSLEDHPDYAALPGLAGAPGLVTTTTEGRATIEGAEGGAVVRLPATHPGYYLATLEHEGGTIRRTLILTPRAARPFPFRQGWGVSAQLYGLWSQRNGGPGDMEDARLLGRELGSQGVSVLGLSPIHALFPANPAHRSPYSPSSRLFWNCAIAPEGSALPSIGGARALSVRSLDYARLLPARIALLRERFAALGRPDMSEEASALRAFVDRFGEALQLQATYDALYAHFALSGHFGAQAWPDEYRRAEGPAASRFAREHTGEVAFWAYAQFLAWRAIVRTTEELRSRNVGLYLDLAVGVDPGGAEAWSRPDLFCAGVSIGAPPDPFAPQGQDWGLAPFAPARLRSDGYRHFVRLLRAAMPSGGMIRMDHAMQLHRLYWQIHDGGPQLGAYVTYPVRELLGILMLESMRNDCSVITEDLGTVPPGFREQLQEAGMYTWKVLYFEKQGDSFSDPRHYSTRSIATVNTHDLPTVRAWWQGLDIQLRTDLGLTTEEDADEAEIERALDRKRLLQALAAARIDVDPANPDDVSAGVHRWIARAGSELVLVNLSDLLGESAAHNVPGTAERPENWALAYSAPAEAVSRGPQAQRILGAMKERIARSRSATPTAHTSTDQQQPAERTQP